MIDDHRDRNALTEGRRDNGFQTQRRTVVQDFLLAIRRIHEGGIFAELHSAHQRHPRTLDEKPHIKAALVVAFDERGDVVRIR